MTDHAFSPGKLFRRLTEAAVFLFPPLLLLALEWQAKGSFGPLLNDAKLYLSIADNALSTGHFIQTARDLPGFVVPPGVPFCLLLLRLLHFSLPMIALVQALLLGASCLLLYRTAKQLFPAAALAAPLLYTLVILRNRLYLSNIFVEHWYLFALCLLLRLLFRDMPEERRCRALNITAVALLLIRPVLLPVTLSVVAGTTVLRLRRHRTATAIAALLLMLLPFGLNLAVNYRETGEWILLENYSGSDLYRATVPNAQTRRSEHESFEDPFCAELYYDPELSMSEKNHIFKDIARQNIREAPLDQLRKAGVRFFDLYLHSYFALPLIPLLGGLFCPPDKKRSIWYAALALNLLLAAMSCFGVPDLRYTLPIWPLATLHFAALTDALLRRLLTKTSDAQA